MPVGSVAGSASFPNMRRITAEELGGIKDARAIFATPERVNRMLDTAVSISLSKQIQQNSAVSGLARYQAQRSVVSDIVHNLPKDTSAAERELWEKELSGVDDSIGYYQNQIEEYKNPTANEVQDSIFKMLATSLGKSMDEVKAMYAEKLNKVA